MPPEDAPTTMTSRGTCSGVVIPLPGPFVCRAPRLGAERLFRFDDPAERSFLLGRLRHPVLQCRRVLARSSGRDELPQERLQLAERRHRRPEMVLDPALLAADDASAP